MTAERRGPAICNVSNIRAGEDGMIKTSNDSQDLRRRIYVKAKAELLRRFWSIRSYAQERRGLGWERWIRQSRKSPQQDRSHKPRHEANGRAQCGKSARCVRCGGDWRRGVVERHLGQSRRACPRPYLQPCSSAAPLARLRGFAGFSMLRRFSINRLAGKVCTTGVGGGRWLWRSAAVAVVATGA